MIDVHCHILPDIDDGPRSVKESLALSELLLREGITTVAATPHLFDSRYPTPTPDQIQSRLAQLKGLLDGRLDIVCGAEVRLVPEVMTVLGRHEVFINTGRYLLVEFPSNLLPHGIEHLLFSLTSSDVHPIIAHPERNRCFRRDPDRLAAFIRMGCYAQLDAPCLLTAGRARQLALRWIAAGLIHFIASDSHRADWRPPRLAAAYNVVKDRCGSDVAETLFVQNPQAAIRDKPLPFVPEIKPLKASVVDRWRGFRFSRG